VEGSAVDGKLPPPEAPFYLAMSVACGDYTIVGTHEIMPKARFSISSGTAKIVFHEPIEPKDFGSRDCLMKRVRSVINQGLPPEYQTSA
jgi:hypothetical protein